MFKKCFLTLMSVILFSAASIAQVTTSGILGYVNEKANPEEPVIGASVVAIHNPSGTRYGTVTNMKGRYSIQGMRTGGPYTIEVSYIGFQKIVLENIYLQLGNDLHKDFEMGESSELLSEVVVTAAAKTKTGAGTQFGQKKLEETPTVSRDLYDVAKLSPMVSSSKTGGISIAGTNNRYNSFQIDGTVSNDVFGLSGSGTNGGQTGSNPISMDAIQELQVVVAPFDVRQSGFTGGAINAITKQGTNNFFGSAYTYYTNQDMWGRYSWTNGHKKDEMPQQSTKTYGATFGGPIIKNKLFFFTSTEFKNKEYPSQYYPGCSSDYLSESDAMLIADKYEAYTGHKESFSPRDEQTKALNFMARIDWNINEKHKLALRYQYNNSFDDKTHRGYNSFTFDRSGHRQKNITNSIVAELNSRFSQEFYNEARFSTTLVRDHRSVGFQGPNVQIKNIKTGVDRFNVTANIGTDFSSGANFLNQDIYTFEDNFNWYSGNHTFTFGTHNEIYRMENMFCQANNGSWKFNSLDDFLNDKPNEFRYNYMKDADFVPELKAGTFGFYMQDKWNVVRGLTLTYGLRVDMSTTFNDPEKNKEFNAFAEDNKLGVQQGKMPGMKPLISPRLGFQWYVDEAHKTMLRGGLGVFTGRVPFVWISNAYGNTGVQQKGVKLKAKYAPELSLGKYANDPKGAADLAKYGLNPDIVTIADNFKYPQVFRANLALEQKLPGDVKFTLEGVYSKGINNVFFENKSLVDNGKSVEIIKGVKNSSMTLYDNAYSKKYNSIINLKNINKGYSYNVSATLEKSFDFGLGLMASYTYGRSRSVNDGTSSVAYSNWKHNYSRNTNDDSEMGYSRFDIPHRVMLQVNYSSPKYWNDWMSTDIAITYNGFSGGRYSMTMDEDGWGDINNDGRSGNNLLYIPTEREMKNMTWKSDEDMKLFNQWIEADSYAKNHRGQFAERNSGQNKWENEVNLHIAQNIFNKGGKGKFQITFDVMNFANMLNKNWGASYGNVWNVAPLKRYKDGSFSYQDKEVRANNIFSRWHAQLGARLVF